MTSSSVAFPNRPGGWYELLSRRPPVRLLTGKSKVDFAVVGAGFCGVAAAFRLARHFPGPSIAIVDKHKVGDGASGRNSGFIVDVGHFNPRLSLSQNKSLVRLQRFGQELLRERVNAFRIDCDWTDSGRFHGAVTPRGERILNDFIGHLDSMNEPYALVNRQEFREMTGTDFYVSVIRTPGGSLVQPAAVICGLAEHLPVGVKLFQNSPVLAIEDTPNAKKLVTPAGELDADRVLICVNGYSSGLAGRSRVFE
jgi:glycine/D-amino acid oxidase-like deaminating enzyme